MSRVREWAAESVALHGYEVIGHDGLGPIGLDGDAGRNDGSVCEPGASAQPVVAPSGECSSTLGRYSTSWMLPSNVRLSVISKATSG
jgi:hypothetical protein